MMFKYIYVCVRMIKLLNNKMNQLETWYISIIHN